MNNIEVARMLAQFLYDNFERNNRELAGTPGAQTYQFSMSSIERECREVVGRWADKIREVRPAFGEPIPFVVPVPCFAIRPASPATPATVVAEVTNVAGPETGNEIADNLAGGAAAVTGDSTGPVAGDSAGMVGDGASGATALANSAAGASNKAKGKGRTRG